MTAPLTRPAVLKGTVNDATTFPPPSKSHGSYHWTFERLLSASLIPVMGSAAVSTGSAYVSGHGTTHAFSCSYRWVKLTSDSSASCPCLSDAALCFRFIYALNRIATSIRCSSEQLGLPAIPLPHTHSNFPLPWPSQPRYAPSSALPFALVPRFARRSTVQPILDGILAVSLIAHSHLGLATCIDDYVHPRKNPVLGPLAMWALRIGTGLSVWGVYEFNTNDIGESTRALRRCICAVSCNLYRGICMSGMGIGSWWLGVGLGFGI